MTNTAPTPDQRLLLDVFDNIPPEWDYDITYPAHPTADYSFIEYPELVLTYAYGSNSIEIAVRAVITNDPLLFSGYIVTTNHPTEALLSATGSNQRLASFSHDELITNGVDISRHQNTGLASDTASTFAVSFAVATSLATYYADIIDTDSVAADPSTQSTVSASNE